MKNVLWVGMCKTGNRKSEHHADYMYRGEWKVPMLYAKTDARAMDKSTEYGC